jgi:hypothetical protein
MLIRRRSLLGGLLAIPAIVRSGSLMPVRSKPLLLINRTVVEADPHTMAWEWKWQEVQSMQIHNPAVNGRWTARSGHWKL